MAKSKAKSKPSPAAPRRRSTRHAPKVEEELPEEEPHVEEPEPVEEETPSEDEEGDNNSDDDDDDDDDDSEVEEEQQDMTTLFKGDEEGDDDDDSNEEDEDADGEEHLKVANSVPLKSREQCTFDLRNMTAMNSHQIPASSLYKSTSKKKRDDDTLCIPMDQGHGLDVDEKYLLSQAMAGCAQLVANIWQLPTESSDAGPLATLPAYDEVQLPRALPPPPPKQDTKWEKFAKAKGIPLNKEKRSRKVWDDATGAWMFRHGMDKANSSSKEWPIMEVGAKDDPFDDPWEKMKDAKRARTEKNLENRMSNEERAGSLAKGTTNRILKSREQSRKNGKVGGNAGRDNVLPTGVPVDLNSGGSGAVTSGETKLRGKSSTTAALVAVQRSTASLGQFDKMREGEPERKKTLSKMKKRKFESSTEKKVVNTEGEKSMKILNAVMNGGGVAKQKAIRKGALAKGETAYDYEYNDGLGASSFKKKKGRAGAGKMKKMTKKRVK